MLNSSASNAANASAYSPVPPVPLEPPDSDTAAVSVSSPVPVKSTNALDFNSFAAATVCASTSSPSSNVRTSNESTISMFD
ncbi:hypothetical protein D3C75_1129190 [compost metagenome]